jgi:hypothetical protein
MLDPLALPILGQGAGPELVLTYLFSDAAQDPVLGIGREYFKYGKYAKNPAAVSVLQAFRRPDVSYSKLIWLFQFFHAIVQGSKGLRIDSIGPMLAAADRVELQYPKAQMRQYQGETEIREWFTRIADEGLSDRQKLMIPASEQRTLLLRTATPDRIRKTYATLEDCIAEFPFKLEIRLEMAWGSLRRIQNLPFGGEPMFAREQSVLLKLHGIMKAVVQETENSREARTILEKLLSARLRDNMKKRAETGHAEDAPDGLEPPYSQNAVPAVFPPADNRKHVSYEIQREPAKQNATTASPNRQRSHAEPVQISTPMQWTSLISMLFSHYLLFLPGVMMSLLWMILVRSYIPLIFFFFIPAGSLMAAASIALGIMDNYYGLLFCKRTNIFLGALVLCAVPLAILGGISTIWVILTGGRSSPFLIPAALLLGLVTVGALLTLWPVFFDAYVFRSDIDRRAWYDDRKFAFGMPRWMPDFIGAWRMATAKGSFFRFTVPVICLCAVNVIPGAFALSFPLNTWSASLLTLCLCGLFSPFLALFGIDRVRALRGFSGRRLPESV